MIPKRKSTLQFSLPTLTVGGVCAGSYSDVDFGWPVSPTSCTVDEFGRIYGLCSEETEQALIQTNCTNSVWSLPRTERQIIRRMIESMCRQEIDSNFFPFFGIVFTRNFGILNISSWRNIPFLDEESHHYQVKYKHILQTGVKKQEQPT